MIPWQHICVKAFDLKKLSRNLETHSVLVNLEKANGPVQGQKLFQIRGNRVYELYVQAISPVIWW